jgi:alkylation response protein AidB-like acyl-CoA dehydrogenase
MLRGDEFWCQLFSEPGAGSDLASLSTRARRDGDQFVVTGQKVWTSYAHFADFGLLLARTNIDVPKHRGITYLIVDMHAPGITVRPLHQMTGHSEFNEVFFDDVLVPAASVIGHVDQGWMVAHATLAHERSYLGARLAGEGRFDPMSKLAHLCRRTGEPSVRQSLAACYTREQILRFLNFRTQTAISRGAAPGPEAAVAKLAVSDHSVRTAADALSLLGARGMLAEMGVAGDSSPQAQFVGSLGIKIGGGTDNMQKKAIAERVLGLPREDDPERSLPWSEAMRRRR